MHQCRGGSNIATELDEYEAARECVNIGGGVDNNIVSEEEHFLPCKLVLKHYCVRYFSSLNCNRSGHNLMLS